MIQPRRGRRLCAVVIALLSVVALGPGEATAASCSEQSHDLLLASGTVSPASGSTATNFGFSVVYTDNAGCPPDPIVVGATSGAAIMAGTINAENILANSITAAKIAAGAVTAVKLSVGGIGGRNMLPNSGFESDFTGWSLSATPPGITSFVVFEGVKCWFVSGSAGYRYAISAVMQFRAGRYYTASFWMTDAGTIATSSAGAGIVFEGLTGAPNKLLTAFTTSWTRYSVTWLQATDQTSSILVTNSYGGTSTNEIRIDAVMVEEGDIIDDSPPPAAGAGGPPGAASWSAILDLSQWPQPLLALAVSSAGTLAGLGLFVLLGARLVGGSPGGGLRHAPLAGRRTRRNDQPVESMPGQTPTSDVMAPPADTVDPVWSGSIHRAPILFNAPPSPGIDRCRIVSRLVPLRSEPDELSWANPERLDVGDEVDVLRQEGPYCFVRTASGSEGWVPGLTLTGASNGAGDPETPPGSDLER